MSCHPLLVDEVFRSIVEELIALSPRTVLSLALCCSSLTDVPLSVLWERQKRLSTLVKVLPPDAWAYEETESPTGQLVGRNRPQSHSLVGTQSPVCRRSYGTSRRKNGRS